jgi:hypothetical protein
MSEFVYLLVILLWPTQPLAVMEVNVGTPVAITYAILANMLLFGVLGLLGGITASSRLGRILLYCVIATLITLYLFHGAGTSSVSILALLVALCYYALLLRMTAKFGAKFRDL